ncbi:MAG: hypothetical protein ACPGVZ_12205 [Myxococcota bacterium]
MAEQQQGQNQGEGIYPIGKAMLGITWLFATACYFPPLDGTAPGPGGRALFGVLAAVHAVECLFFLPVLRKSARPLIQEIWQTFLFGIVHVSTLRREQEGQ